MRRQSVSKEGLSPTESGVIPQPFQGLERLAPKEAHNVTFILGTHIDEESLPASVERFFTEDLDLIFLEGMSWQERQLELTQQISEGSLEAQTTLLGLHAYGRNHPGYRYATRRLDLIRDTGAKVVQIDYEATHPELPGYIHIVQNQHDETIPIKERLAAFKKAPGSAFKKQCQKFASEVFIPTFMRREQLWAERILATLQEAESSTNSPQQAIVVLGSMHAPFAEIMTSLIKSKNSEAEVGTFRTDSLPETYLERAYKEYMSDLKVQKRTALLLLASRVLRVKHDRIEEFMRKEDELDDQFLVDVIKRSL